MGLSAKTVTKSAKNEKVKECIYISACGQTLQKIIPLTYRPPTETHNMTAGLWFSVVGDLPLKDGHGIFQNLSLESQYMETLKRILP